MDGSAALTTDPRARAAGARTDGVALQSATAFRMRCTVAIAIDAPAARVWQLLTDAGDFPRWNSTVTAIEGAIAHGARLAIRVPVAPGRVFRPKVVGFEPMRRMVWSDGAAPMFKGTRTFDLTAPSPETTRFEMDEVFAGLMLPMIRGSLPDFGPVFERYATDLKREAERKPS